VATPLGTLKHKARAYLAPFVTTRMARREALTGVLFITPWLLGFLLLKLVPIACSLVFSLTDFDMLQPEAAQFIGLDNYAQVFADGYAGFNLFTTLSVALITLPLQLFTALGLASLLNGERVFGKQIHRTLIFLPSVIPGAAIAFVWFGFLDPTTGWLNRLLIEPLGLPPYPGPFTTSGLYLYQVITALWSIGPGFLVMLGAIKGVPSELYEAARVDGAGPIMRFLRVTVPIISPAIFFSLVINLVSIFGGAPLLDRGSAFSGGGQSAFDNYIYLVMFRQNRLGYASSLAWVMFVMMLLVTIILFRTARYWVYYPEDE
jgi:ABC-type sugar transport system permease subunit